MERGRGIKKKNVRRRCKTRLEKREYAMSFFLRSKDDKQQVGKSWFYRTRNRQVTEEGTRAINARTREFFLSRVTDFRVAIIDLRFFRLTVPATINRANVESTSQPRTERRENETTERSRFDKIDLVLASSSYRFQARLKKKKRKKEKERLSSTRNYLAERHVDCRQTFE